MKHSWKNSHACRGNRNRSSRLKIQCSNHWAKESTPWRSCQRVNIYLEAMRNLPRQIIEGRSARSLHSPFSRKSSFMMTWSRFRRIKSYPGRAPILRYESRNKGMKHSWKNSHACRGNRTRSSRLKIQCSNHWAKESTPWRSCQRVNIYLEAMRNLPRQIIEGRSARSLH